ncbi:MAG TPA: reductive dehalogenase domain-containing protein [Syntrophorhabdaceae bacterium]|nr:reductive dehalogenase domain-containing protein [Syntrophorhabdaceae bacterium]HRV23547.1 reductive dehalogenase domain-containing protein [Syntrophorhabdaceae bacterium]
MEDNNRMIEGWFKDFEIDIYGFGDMSLYEDDLVQMDNTAKGRLPYAISFGLVLSKAVLDTVTDGPNLLYLHHYRQLNYRLDMVGYMLSKKIEERGYNALPFAASQVVDWRNQKAHISHKKVGVISGIGWIGRNNLLIHPVFGAYVRYNTVLTDIPLVVNERKGFSCGECRACLVTCPAGAIKEDPASFDHLGCYEMLTQFKNKRNLGHHICGLCIKVCRGKR